MSRKNLIFEVTSADDTSAVRSASYLIDSDLMADALDIIDSTGGLFDVEDEDGAKFTFPSWEQILLATEKLVGLVGVTP